MENTTELLKGVLEGLVLEIIGHESTYGYAITQQLRILGFAEVVEGTVYTILVRLEKGGYVETERRPSEAGPARKFYTLTESGVGRLHIFWEKWDSVSAKVNELRSI